MQEKGRKKRDRYGQGYGGQRERKLGKRKGGRDSVVVRQGSKRKISNRG